ncbi:hypothetical protein DL93DRAFT_1239680 [Clavulina sp. PMI_390]|nr:hypothetical protein DL93DRAFT_1239680 [Clavulina sp. PMI_390]
MIVEPSTSYKGDADHGAVTRVVSRNFESPPAYLHAPTYTPEAPASTSLRQADAETASVHSSSTSSSSDSILALKLQQRRKRRRKWIAIFFVSFVVYTIALVVVVIKKPWKSHFHASTIYIPPPWTIPTAPLTNSSNSGGGGSGDPSGGDHSGLTIQCSAWDTISPDNSYMQTYFPPNTSEIFINNMAGGWVGGSLHVLESGSNDANMTGYYKVQVTVQPRFQNDGDDIRENINVCVLGGSTFGSFGVGVYNANQSSQAPITVNIDVFVPPKGTLPSFATFLPNFSQNIGSNSSLKLTDLSIGGPADKLFISGGEARKVQIISSSSFSGTVTVSESLTIQSTSSSSINANVTLVYRGQPFSLSLQSNQA